MRGINTLAPWEELLKFRYESFTANFLYGEGTEGLKHASIWWRDVWRLGGEGDGDWFGTNVSNVLGDGKNIGFWKEKWLGMEPLRALYPSLFAKSTQQNDNVSTMGTWDNNNWSWRFVWTVPLTETETTAEAEIRLLLEQVQICRDNKDRRRWIPNKVGTRNVNLHPSERIPAEIAPYRDPKTGIFSPWGWGWRQNFPRRRFGAGNGD
ncbi:hypothetical protein TSUD_141780 [Trifolium subterraneum]|uniref:Reverse transcriptase zinc-binding domain-containing protein n=1 Tax=Trifolium subterraneum TaxID=3900 RepID=A0A2Z6PN05_TRISU|nr:hypothetical protein TSUD_141780 [Trifolium subterraneum]